VADIPAWVVEMDQAVTRVSRAARSPRLHQLMGSQAKVDVGEHLHLTLAMLGASEPTRVSDLATLIDVERSTVSRRVAELVSLGLVTRSVDPDDRRAAVLRLTKPGQRALGRIQNAWLRTLFGLTQDWPARRRSETTANLNRLADVLEGLLAAEND
jgi:DNA-binding MarR family transcriptional regulator